MIEISSNTGTVNVGSTLGITKEQVEKLKNPKFAERIKTWCILHHVTHRLHEKTKDNMPKSCMGRIFDTPIIPSALEKDMQALHEEFLAFIDSLEEETDQDTEHGDSKKMLHDLGAAVKKLCEQKDVKHMLIAVHEEEEEMSIQASGDIPASMAMMLLCDVCHSEE